MRIRITYWQDGEHVKAQFDLGGSSGGRIRGQGEPTHTGTHACAGVLTLYPEAWEQLHGARSDGAAIGTIDVEFVKGG